jgi:hypothetical protein
MRTNDNGIDRDMTEDELANYEISSSIYLAKAKAETEAAEAKAEAKAAAEAKLVALGLTTDDLQALGL